MRSNPMIRKGMQEQIYEGEVMSVKGTRQKTLLLVGITAIAAILSYVFSMNALMNSGDIATVNRFLIVGGVVGLMSIMTMMFKAEYAKVLGIVYAVSEGIVLGAASLIFSLFFEGIVLKAVVLTLLAVIFTVLLYKENPGLATKMRRGVMIMTLSILAASIVGFLFSIFGVSFVFWEGGIIGIGFSILVTGVAIANLMIDYDNITYGVQTNLPKHMEWFFAAGILVTIVWIYVELLNLLSKLASRE